MKSRELLGVGEVADIIGLKVETVYVMHSEGKLPEPDAYANGGRTKLWERRTIKTWDKKRRKAKR